MSGGRCDLLDTLEKVHNYGCKVAAASTAQKQADKPDKKLRRGKDTTHYRGSYWLDVAQVRGIDTTGMYSVELFATPIEPDRPEHCDIALVPKAVLPEGIEKDALKTEIIAQLRLCLRDPQAHICQCDIDLSDMLLGIGLLASPDETKVIGWNA